RHTLVTVLVGVVAVLVGAVVYLAVDRGGAPDGEGSGLAAATSSAPAATDGTGSTDAAGSTGAAEASSSNAPSSGSYTGTLQQRGTSSTRQDRDYAVEMTFSSGGSSVRYPGLGCAGTLVPRGDSGVDRIYREEIHTGRCDDGGTWTVTRVGDGRLDVNYEAPTGRYVVTGTLTR
ncbi:MAG TPA: hypothetical protein GX694_13690, partial [Actinomycetales bacterium]|nr:hypothetical protein [Actinomycetales bacterium]